MSIYFVVSAPNASTRLTREAEFRSTYASHDIRGPLDLDEAETVGIMQVEDGGLRSFCGSSRVDSATATAIQQTHSDWLAVYENADFLDSWDYP